MRLTKDQAYVEIAKVIAKRSTCLRRAVGAVAVDRDGYILATGYNGVAAGLNHCNEQINGEHPHACIGAKAPSGTNLDACGALHAEQNLILHLKDPREVETVYLTTSPCISCVKLLMGTAAKRIVFVQEYPNSEASKVLWLSKNRVWEHYKDA